MASSTSSSSSSSSSGATAHERPALSDEPSAKRQRIDATGAAGIPPSSSAWRPKAVDDEELSRRREQVAGIQCFLGQSRGFTGTLKQRYSDFLVNEVALDGRVVHLTDLSPPESSDASQLQSDAERTEAAAALMAQIEHEIGAEAAAATWSFLRDTDAKARRSGKHLLPPCDDKAKRTALHQQFKELDKLGALPAFYTTTENGCVAVCFQQNKKDNHFSSWPASRPKYCKFVLYKENRDTTECIGTLNRMLGLKSNVIQYAGTKDKRGITCQEATVHQIDATRLQQVSRGLHGAALGNFRYVAEPLRLGDLYGNRFDIVLRNVHGDDEQIASSITELQTLGFINYFGMQRFGTAEISTDRIGLAILKSDWQQAVELIMSPAGVSFAPEAEAREFYLRTHNAKATLAKCTKLRGMNIERQLMQGLVKNGDRGFLNAIMELPRNLRMLYPHGYQSRIWNQMVSKRLELYGLQVVEGDLVLDSSSGEAPKQDDDAGVAYAVAKVLTAEQVGSYTIEDVVLPLPGFDVKLPGNAIADEYHAALAADGLDMEKLKHLAREFVLAGGYRKIIEKAHDLEWRVMRYDDDEKPLTLSDLERLSGKPEPESVAGGSKKAVRIAFTLKSACYATMCLREALKRSTTFSTTTTTTTTTTASSGDAQATSTEPAVAVE